MCLKEGGSNLQSDAANAIAKSMQKSTQKATALK
jgi:hypothetical protein